MSDQARIETAIDTTIDNCEVLRARLAKYEDADGKPITTIAEQAREISSLRNIISECATACGAAVSVECSEEFMAMLPDEIRTVMTGKTLEVERLSLMVSQADHDYDCDRSDWQRDLAAMKAQPSGVVQWPDADEIMQMAFEEGQPGDDASGYYFELEEFDLFIQRLMEEVARLNQPASAGDEPIRYWFIGDVGQEAGQRRCKKSMHDGSLALFESENDAKRAVRRHPGTEVYLVEYYRKPQARAALSANHSEQVRVVLPKPLKRGDAEAERGEYGGAMVRGYSAYERQLIRLNPGIAFAASPSAGSQKEQG